MKNKITIVGPVKSNEKMSGNTKGNSLTAFFLMAKYDDEFLDSVLNNREKAIKEKRFEFTKSEKLIIDRLENSKLKRFVKSFKISGISKESLPSWKSVAAILVLVATITLANTSCRPKEQIPKGHTHIQKDINNDTEIVEKI